MNDDLISRDLTQDDCFRLPELLKNVWKIKTTRDYWYWKYFDSPFKNKGMVIENKNGDILAFVGFWERLIKVRDNNIYAYTSLDLMIEPKYRGGKIFSLLIKRIKSELLGNHVFFGFPNLPSYKLHHRFFRNLITVDAKIPVFKSPINIGTYIQSNKSIKNIANIFSRIVQTLHCRISRNKKIQVQEVHDFGDEFDQLWKNICGEYLWVQDRRKDFLQWRFVSHPLRRYKIWKATEQDEIVGYLVATINRGQKITQGFLMDWFVSRKRVDVFQALVNTAFVWFIDQKVDVVETWLMNHEKQWKRILKKYYFRKSKKSRLFLYGMVPSFERDEPIHDNVQNFFFTFGDSDYLGTTDI